MEVFKFALIFIIVQIAKTIDLESSPQDLSNDSRVQTLEDLELYGFNYSEVDPSVLEDAFLTTPELLIKYGYPAEKHKVHTPDGYILEVHRIPRPGSIPVFLQHGLTDSSGGWVIMGPHSAFAYYLYDLGYDVWMGNIRGNRYSRSHIYLSPKTKEFWDYSFNEIGTLDVPAMIDHVLDTTGHKKLHYIGHSQGTTAFWTMCSMRIGYCDKIISMQALAPIAYMKYVQSPIIRALAPLVNQLDFLFNIMGAHEFLPNNDFFKLAGQAACKEEAISHALCMNALFMICGYNSEQFNATMIPALLGHFPAGSSTKQFIHYGQLVNSGRFRMFDYGLLGNRKRYGTFKPPSYDFKKVTAPVALHYSSNDWLADLRDVAKLQLALPNVIQAHLIPMEKFNHIDFIVAINSRDLVYEKVVKIMKAVERGFPNVSSNT